ncbi:MAG TPA: glycoside hydrolase family 2 TIM barrel-domain containing protein, partial [Puia sp.]|nr:glycoside hydrolase family 2 TIM barrel-domain containing protein [Puia sp.]
MHCRLLIFLCLTAFTAFAQPRRDILLNTGWRTSLIDSNNWRSVDIPHNWDDYAGYRRLRHGNLHGSALYTRTFSVTRQPGKRYFLWFEGVGSYATVRVNKQPVGTHAGGRTSFTLDITDALKTDALKTGAATNDLEVRADHPANIRDLPWVCGGCSDERGFSEGSQPLGIFRPVHLIITNETRIEPFGVHIWNDTSISERSATLYLETELKNYGTTPLAAEITQQLLDKTGTPVATVTQTIHIDGTTTATKSIHLTGTTTAAQPVPIHIPGTTTIRQELPNIRTPHLWSPSSPYLYTLVTTIRNRGGIIDQTTTAYGIRRIHWTDPAATGPHPFTVNGRPVFLNGIAEYEHRIGNSHAFTHAEIKARAQQIRAAGFNAFRDAHQPHNLYYQHFWDSLGILWWPQFSAHIWFDSPGFRENFKTTLTEWIKERRNSPSVILWGLQNESKLPEDFAKECVALIRQLDPTASGQRLIVTCNGGSGTDWDVPQNWTGTYGGDPATYGKDLIRQVLVGEYGAWRTADLHGDTTNSEDRMCALMEQKIRLADSVRSQVAGHFAWLYTSHDNPGRVQSGEGERELDRIGPVNYKGLLTEWEEPLDPYYLYRANFTDPHTDPMVYIVSHSWPHRWETPGIKSGIIVYSNCDTVELFNGKTPLGIRTRHDIGTHFQWDSVDIQYNT